MKDTAIEIRLICRVLSKVGPLDVNFSSSPRPTVTLHHTLLRMYKLNNIIVSSLGLDFSHYYYPFTLLTQATILFLI